MKCVWLVAAVTALAGCPTPEAVDGTAGSATATSDVAAEAEQAMRALAKRNALEGVESAIEAGPLETRVARAIRVGAYPGTGVFRVVVADGATFGHRGARDLAELARARGWHRTPPDASDLFRLVSAAQHDGLLARAAGTPAAAEVVDGDLVLTAVLSEPFNDATHDLRVTFPATGMLTSTRTARPATASKPATKGAVEALKAALASHDSMEILDAIEGVKGNQAPERFAALASAAVIDNDRISRDALAALGSSDDGLRALRTAAATLAPAQRAQLASRVLAVLGPEAAKRLK